MSRRAEMGHAQKNETPKLRQQPGSQCKATGQTKATRSNSGTAAADSRSQVIQNLRAQQRREWLSAKPEPTSHWKRRRLALILNNHPGNSVERQRERIKMAFALVRAISTHECREYLDVTMPNARIWELRHVEGLSINTAMVIQRTAAGRPHRFAKYFLAQKEAA